MLHNSMMVLIGKLNNKAPLYLPVPEEILDIIIANLGEDDLDNLKEVGDAKIKRCANRRLKKLKPLKSKF